MLTDVDRIIYSHRQLNHDGLGRRGLGHITRSGVLMLCAAWELYVEEVMLEGVTYFSDKIDNPKELPNSGAEDDVRFVLKAEIRPACRKSKADAYFLLFMG